MKWKATCQQHSTLGSLASIIFIMAIAIFPGVGYGADIVDAEYFFDTDPGEGNGEPLPAVDGTFDSPGESVDFTGVDLSGLKIGGHTIYARFKSTDGVWG